MFVIVQLSYINKANQFTLSMLAPQTLAQVSPAHHAVRGASAALLAATAVANLMGNRKALLTLLQRQQLTRLTLAPPSRNIAALALFIGASTTTNNINSIAAI